MEIMKMIEKIPLEIDPPEPMPSPPLRRKPFPMPQFSTIEAFASVTPFPSIFD
jgi:hypothetical protein